MLAVLGNQQRELQAAVSQAKKREKEKTNPEKEGCVLPCRDLGWKSFYSHLFVVVFPLPFRAPAVGLGAGQRWMVTSHPSCESRGLWFGDPIQLCEWGQVAMLFVSHEGRVTPMAP